MGVLPAGRARDTVVWPRGRVCVLLWLEERRSDPATTLELSEPLLVGY